MPAVAKLLSDGKRLHLNHGPIDLIIEAYGPASSVSSVYRATTKRFETVLPELVNELEELRLPFNPQRNFTGNIATSMNSAITGLATGYITPMAAVAGAVADEVASIIAAHRKIQKAYVNNGGDIALYLKPDNHFVIAIDTGNDRIRVNAGDNIGGVATSGWRGRSHSLGIADAVTVLAANCATADACATVIANAVDLPGNLKITRTPANLLSPDTDLGERPVTTAVDLLSAKEVKTALEHGREVADALLRCGMIKAAMINLQGEKFIIGKMNSTTRQMSHATG